MIGVALRLAILAVPSAIPALREEFGLTGTEIGALSGAPIVIFAAASLAGAGPASSRRAASGTAWSRSIRCVRSRARCPP